MKKNANPMPMLMRALVKDALNCVKLECPEAHQAMTTVLGHRGVKIQVDGESFTIRPHKTDAPTIELRSRASALYKVLTGEQSALDAILTDEIILTGAADDLVAAGEAALLFAKGAIRCASRDSLLVRLKHLAEKKKG